MGFSSNGSVQKNVLGGTLKECCRDPLTGFYRDGACRTGPDDGGRHLVCAIMTEAFLRYTRARGNDLSSPRPELHFPGLQPGDKWCLSVLRWKEALEGGVAPPIILESTHEQALNFVDREDLERYAVRS